MNVRFHRGDQGEIHGVDWRIVSGRKKEGDLRLEIRAMEFVPVSMKVGFLFADFYAQNEELLYPSSQGFSGVGRYLVFCEGAARMGWAVAAEQLDVERTKAAERRSAA